MTMTTNHLQFSNRLRSHVEPTPEDGWGFNNGRWDLHAFTRDRDGREERFVNGSQSRNWPEAWPSLRGLNVVADWWGHNGEREVHYARVRQPDGSEDCYVDGVWFCKDAPAPPPEPTTRVYGQTKRALEL